MRSHLPGVAFHITARLQGQEPLFVGIEAAAVNRIMQQACLADVLLLAYAIMPNHLHLVLVQGARPLASFMQPVMRHLALLVMQARARQGHVFERPYKEVACLDAEHLRNSLAYVHLNGCRAGLCQSADDFTWCSHSMMCDAADTLDHASRCQLGMETALRMFATKPGQTLRECRRDYRAFLRWRIDMDHHIANGGSRDFGAPSAPYAAAGDAFWLDQFSRCAPSRAEARGERSLPNLRDLALVAIRQHAPGMHVDELRSGSRARAAVRVRRFLVPRALQAGHSPQNLARFLNISRTTISAILHHNRTPTH